MWVSFFVIVLQHIVWRPNYEAGQAGRNKVFRLSRPLHTGPTLAMNISSRLPQLVLRTLYALLNAGLSLYHIH